MAPCDFVIKFDPKKDTPETVTKKILYSIFIRRIKAKKPVVAFISGESGEGKSWGSLKLQEVLAELQGYSLKDYIDIINVYTPLQYPEKIDSILFDKQYKKVNMISIHEARELLNSKDWQNFLTRSISDVNAMSRSIKRLIIIIVSQFIRDITTDIRYTLNYYIKVSRPLGKRSRLTIHIMWKDDRDLEKPKLRKRKLQGYLVYPDGKYRRFIPKYLELSKPSKEIVDKFEKSDYDSKALLLRKKLTKMVDGFKSEIGDESEKVGAMVDYYTTNVDNLSAIGKKYRGKWKLKADVKVMHDLTKEEAVRFESRLNEVLKEKGVIEK